MSRWQPDFNSYAQLFTNNMASGRDVIDRARDYEARKAAEQRQKEADLRAEEDRKLALQDRERQIKQEQEDRDRAASDRRIKMAEMGYAPESGPLASPEEETARNRFNIAQQQEQADRSAKERIAIRSQANDMIKNWKSNGFSFQDMKDSADRLADPALKDELENALGVKSNTQSQGISKAVDRYARFMGLDQGEAEALSGLVAQIAQDSPEMSTTDALNIATQMYQNRRGASVAQGGAQKRMFDRIDAIERTMNELENKKLEVITGSDFMAQPEGNQNRVLTSFNQRLQALEKQRNALVDMMNSQGPQQSMQQQTETAVNELGQTVGARPQAPLVNPFSNTNETFSAPTPRDANVMLNELMGGGTVTSQQQGVAPSAPQQTPKPQASAPPEFENMAVAKYQRVMSKPTAQGSQKFVTDVNNAFAATIKQYQMSNDGQMPSMEEMQTAYGDIVDMMSQTLTTAADEANFASPGYF